jgi:hypothetical protein
VTHGAKCPAFTRSRQHQTPNRHGLISDENGARKTALDVQDDARASQR